jgi:NADH-quinone oxidoreductase subunit L
MHFWVVFLPLLGACLTGILGHIGRTRKAAIIFSCGPMILAMLIGILLSIAQLKNPSSVHDVHLFEWIHFANFHASWSLHFDTLSIMMISVVTIVSTVVHLYSIGYMHDDPSFTRFMAYLSLFTFFMLLLVTSNNLLQLFVGWEGVGLCSYLLIGFWYEKESANSAAIKAFLVNRVGDMGFLLGLLTLFYVFKTIEFEQIFASVHLFKDVQLTFLGFESHAITVICLLLFVGAMGKSAQLGLHTWLPDAMEGPTPVSALIHAATMVTAGVFLVCRMSPLFEHSEVALQVMAIVGAATAFFAATVGLVQNDIKRVIAYSTCSQLGYMFFAAGMSAYAASMFHLMTHAFFKALLFLGSGSVIHALSGEQDLRKMGGIYKKIPITYALMWIGSLALAGIPFFSGYYSKDLILEAAYAAGTSVGKWSYVMGSAAALLTALYSWRLIILAFHGKPRASEDVMHHVHESPKIMILPLLILPLGALFAGWGFYDLILTPEFWGKSLFVASNHHALEDAHHVAFWVKVLPLILALLGIFMAWFLYTQKENLPEKISKMFKPLYLFLLNKWYFDELYQAIFINPFKKLGNFLWKKGDVAGIDAFGPNGAARLTTRLSLKARAFQTGYLYHYAYYMFVGTAIAVSWLVFVYFKS